MGADATDLQLFEDWCAGDQRAGRRLFERHYRSIARYFKNKVTRDHDDLTQRTFLACVESRANYRRDASFRSFLFGVARKVLLRWLREHARHDSRFEFNEISVADLDPGPSTIVNLRREQALVVEALRRLPLHYQETLELYYWEGLDGPAIAEAVGTSEANVRNRLHRGRRALERALLELAAGLTVAPVAEQLDSWARSVDPLRG